MSKPFFVIESDDHNADLLHKFRNIDHAARYVASLTSQHTPHEVKEIWRLEGTYEDESMTNWSPDDGEPNIIDHTEDK